MEISLRYSPVTGRLHTRYAPVRRSPAVYCYTPLPLDLHVLSLPLAFILSQDQTLHCKNCFFTFDSRVIPLYLNISILTHAISCFILFNVLALPPFSTCRFFGESECNEVHFNCRATTEARKYFRDENIYNEEFDPGSG